VRAGRARWKATVVAALAVPCVIAAASPAMGQVPGRQGAALRRAGTSICQSWKGHDAMARKISRDIRAVLDERDSSVAIRVDDQHLGIGCWFHASRHFYSASTVKVTIISALLHKAHVQGRSLTTREKDLAWQMITHSDNDAATALWNDVGRRSLNRFLQLAKMTDTTLGYDGYWGLTLITAHDEMLLLKLLLSKNQVLTKGARHYVLDLMAHVIPSQRWGVPAGAPTSFNVHVKNGWLPLATHGWRIHSIGCFTHLDQNYSIVVLSEDNPTMSYGVRTVEGLARVINHGLNPTATSVIPPSHPFPSWGEPDEHIPPDR
jgi:beta-lactamase class A